MCHISYYEADALPAGRGAVADRIRVGNRRALQPVSGNFVESGELHPRRRMCASRSRKCSAMCGSGRRARTSYPGFKPAAGAVGEYNGKFMCNQMVLRGGSCATPQSHIRASYRNFFPPHVRWQFMGIRLANGD